MYIFSQDGMQLVDSERVERFAVFFVGDAALVSAIYSDDRQARTIGRYKNREEAKDALQEMARALAGGISLYYMCDGTLRYEESMVHGARAKRRGGS